MAVPVIAQLIVAGGVVAWNVQAATTDPWVKPVEPAGGGAWLTGTSTATGSSSVGQATMPPLTVIESPVTGESYDKRPVYEAIRIGARNKPRP